MSDSVQMRSSGLAVNAPLQCDRCGWYYPWIKDDGSGRRPMSELLPEAKKHARANRGHVVTITRSSTLRLERIR